MSVLLVAGVAAAVGLISYVSWRFSEDQTIKRALQKAERWPIAELPENTHGRIVGRARPVDETLTSPITKRPCVYYVVIVKEGGGEKLKHVLRDEQGVPFVIEDETGRALIDPKDCSIVLETDRVTESGHDDDATGAEDAVLARHGEVPRDWIGNRQLHYFEAVIEIGETVAVLGSGIREPDPEGAPGALYRGMPATRLRLTSSARFPLVISDHASTTRD